MCSYKATGPVLLLVCGWLVACADEDSAGGEVGSGQVGIQDTTGAGSRFGGGAGDVDPGWTGATVDVSTGSTDAGEAPPTPDAVVDGEVADSGVDDAGIRNTADLGGTDADAGQPTVGRGELPEGPCGYGKVLGLICSPNDQVFVNNATVWIDTFDCSGNPIHLETVSDMGGFYTLENVPSGYQVVHYQSGSFKNEHTIVVKAGKTTDVTGFGYKQCFKVTNDPEDPPPTDPVQCETGAILGTLCEGDGFVITDPALVYVNTVDCNGEFVYVEVASAPNGTYALDGVPVGPVWVFIEMNNLAIQVQTTVQADQTTVLDPLSDPICFPKEPCGFGSATGKVCTLQGNAWISAATITAKTTDCDGKPVTVTTQSQADGSFALGGLPVGTQWLVVEYDGGGYQVPVEILKGTTTDVGVVGAPSCNPGGGCGYGALSGYVCAPSGVKVGNATVYVTAMDCDGTPVSIVAQSDGQGNYFIDGVPSGTVTVQVVKGNFSVTYTVPVEKNQTTPVSDVVLSICFPKNQAKLAVVTGDWDHIQSILDKLGLTYDLYDGTNNVSQAVNLLTNLPKLMEYDVVFFNCGADHYGIFGTSTLISQNLQTYVQAGHSIYASDWAFIYAEAPWAYAIDFYGDDASNSGPKVGASKTVTGVVQDPNLLNYLGKSQVTIKYDLGAWVVVQSVVAQVITHISGYISEAGGNVPLMMSHHPYGGEGRVLYTTFHNEPQATQDMTQILYYLVFEL